MQNVSLLLVFAQAITVLLPMLLSLTVHEYAHARVARYLGDPTAESMGRLTLNPFAHADLWGTILLPLMSLMASGFGTHLPIIGWAKPVPINANRFTRRISVRSGILMVALAGPFANLLLAFGCAGVLALGLYGQWPVMTAGGTFATPPLILFLMTSLSINVGLFVFNMIPISPLDGQQVLSSLLSVRHSLQFSRFNAQYGPWLLLFLVLFAQETFGVPIRAIRQLILACFGL